MTLANYIEACAEKLYTLWPERHAYTEELPSESAFKPDADSNGSFFIRLVNTSQEMKLGDWRRREVSIEILYFLSKRENALYNEWADMMLMNFDTLRVADGTDESGDTVYKLHRTKNAKAYRDDDNRIHHFIFDIEHDFYVAPPENEVMGTLEEVKYRKGR